MPRIIRIIALATALLLATAPRIIPTSIKPPVVIPGSPSAGASQAGTPTNRS